MPNDQFSHPSESKIYDINQEKSKPMTFGEKLVGLTFNPSNDDKVSKAKKLCAELADLLFADDQQSERSPMKELLLEHAYGEILNAQMNCVKVLTLKY